MNIVVAHALRRGLDPEVNPEAAARELAQLAQQRRWVLVHARAVIARRVVERPSPVGDKARALLDRALLFTRDPVPHPATSSPADPSVHAARSQATNRGREIHPASLLSREPAARRLAGP